MLGESDEKNMKSNLIIMEKQIIQDQQEQQQQQQQTLKCPRCDSSNTKFCYYNNYSLSQPRHFCKSCKRYWTRGGTLRNVPLGGTSRKNKKIKKPNFVTSVTSSINLGPHFHDPQVIDHTINPLFNYGLPTNPFNSNIQFPRLFNFPRVSNSENLGLGFPNEFKKIQDVVTSTNCSSSTSLLLSYPNFGSSLTSSSNSNLATLVAPSFHHQQNFITNNDKFQDSNYHEINRIEEMSYVDNPSLSWAGDYVDPSNLGFSLPSLI